MTREDGVFRSVTVSDLESLAQEIVGKLNDCNGMAFSWRNGVG